MANKERVKLWVDALRSGKYQQGRWGLSVMDARGERRYCCLGVACEVAIAAGLQVARSERPMFQGPDVIFAYGSAAHVLPDSVREWFGLESLDPSLISVYGHEERVNASALNDQRYYTFEQIADAIERTHLTGEDEDGQ